MNNRQKISSPMKETHKHRSTALGLLLVVFLLISPFFMGSESSVFAGTCTSSAGYEGECVYTSPCVDPSDPMYTDSCVYWAGDHGIPASATNGTVNYKINMCTSADVYFSDNCTTPVAPAPSVDVYFSKIFDKAKQLTMGLVTTFIYHAFAGTLR